MITSVVARPTGRMVCAAIAEAMHSYRVPLEVLPITASSSPAGSGPKAGEVLFDRICRDNTIGHRPTQPRPPTTTGIGASISEC